jgi:chromosomal replication initiator protein
VVDRLIEIQLPGRAFSGSPALSAKSERTMVMPTFVAGPENRLLASAIERLLGDTTVRAAADGDATSDVVAAASPLPQVFAIHGSSGVGKTHLARGIVQRWQERHGPESAEYLTASDFRHLLIAAIKSETVAEFRQKIQARRLLAIDELDRLSRDPYVQQELRSTLDALAERGGTLLVTSTQAVSTLRNLNADIRSRLSVGLVLQLMPPEDAAKKRILRQASSTLGRSLSDEAARRLAVGIRGTASELLGALFELFADRVNWAGGDVRCVERYLAIRGARRPSLRSILQAVAKYCAVPQKMMKSSSRRQSVVLARSIAAYLSRELAGVSYKQIGAALGGRDHSTIMHSHRKIKRQIARDLATRTAIEELRIAVAANC